MPVVQNSDEGLELRVLKAVVTSSTEHSMPALGQMTEEHFGHDSAKLIFRRLRNLLQTRGSLLTWTMLLSDPVIPEHTRIFVGGVTQNFSESWDAPTFGQALSYLEHYRKIRLAYALTMALAASYDDGSYQRPDEIFSKIEQEFISKRASPTATQAYELGGERTAAPILERILSGVGGARYIPTGFQFYDDINYGLPLGTLFVCTAASGVGKTHMALYLSLQAAFRGERVVFWSLEMSVDQIWARVFACLSGIDSQRIFSNQLQEDERQALFALRGQVDEMLAKSGGKFRVERPNTVLGIDEILHASMAHDATIITIDQLTHIGGVRGDDQAKAMGRVSTTCLQFAASRNVLVILITQQDDDTGRVKYSRAVNEDAGFLWAMEPDEDDHSIIHVRMPKSRTGKPLCFSLKAERAVSRFQPIEGSVHHGPRPPKKRKDQAAKEPVQYVDLKLS